MHKCAQKLPVPEREVGVEVGSVATPGEYLGRIETLKVGD